MYKEQVRKAVIYCRVSTKEQVEEGNSLNTQQKICKEYALKNNYEISAVFVEQGESAKTADRTELKKLLAFCALKKNNISAVIAYKIDRISRNTDDYSQIRILLKRYGVEIKSTSEYFEDTPAGRFMENIIANVAQFDNDVRAERSTAGMKEAVREGRYVWQAPVGYSNVRVGTKATIAPNALAPLIRKTFETIALNQQPAETVRKRMKGLIMSGGKPISKSCFYRMINNELYAGWIYKFGERRRGNFQPIISDELYSKVQDILGGSNKKQLKRISDNPDFPLRRFFRHPSGKLLTGCWSSGNTKKYPYYLIHHVGFNIRKERLESAFKEWLNHFTIDIDHFEKLYSELKAYLDGFGKNWKTEKINLERQIIELKAMQSKIINKNIEGVINDELCKEKLKEINAKLFDTQQALSNVQAPVIDKDRVLKITQELLLHPGDLWEKADLNGKIKLQWFYFPEGIEIDKNGSRTSNICKLFKLKHLIQPIQSFKVSYRNQKSNILKLQISLPSEEKGSIDNESLLPVIYDEVQRLASILHSEHREGYLREAA